MLSGAVDDWLDGIPRRSSPSSQPRTLVVAKSLSTFIYPHVSRLGVPMALLTPVLSPADFDPTRSVIPVPGDDDYEPGSAPEPLICAGTADPLYRSDRAHRLSGLVHEYPQANHSIGSRPVAHFCVVSRRRGGPGRGIRRIAVIARVATRHCRSLRIR